MGRLTATMVVDLTDKTGGKTKAIIGNLDRLKRAERDYMLADKGLRLSNRDRALERVMMERERSIAERQASIAAWSSRAGLATAALGYGAVSAYRRDAELERDIGRIVINANKGRDAIDPVVNQLRKIADDNRMPFQNVVDGFRTLIASGREMEEALAFLPSVALTAQASGSAVNDIGLTADAVAGALKVSAGDMQKAFDQLVEGGKLGKFELNEMSQYLPTIAPAFAALGYEGADGLAKLVAMLQTVRMQTGTSAEAATNFENVINKIYSAETARKFQKNFGINLPKALDETRKRGGDVLQTFLKLTTLATKGDLTKLSMIFEDTQAQKGLRALMMLGDETEQFYAKISSAAGTAQRDAAQIFQDSKSQIDRLANNWDRFYTNIGNRAGVVLNPLLEDINEAMSKMDAIDRAYGKRTTGEQHDLAKEFYKKYEEVFPGTNPLLVNDYYEEALAKVGRGEMKTVVDDLNAELGRRRGGAIMDRYLTGPGGRDSGRQGSNRAPVPGWRPGSREANLYGVTDNRLGPRDGYPGRGSYEPRSYDRDYAPIDKQTDRARRRELLRNADPAALGMDGLGGVIIEQSKPSGPQSVSVSGPVTIANPPPRPNVSVRITINEATDAAKIADQIGKAIQSEMNGIHVSTNDSGL